ncbi:MAG TPA: MBL fold metallo-hydrolase [Steroidobacteraceae bacterium]|nr:MBL fold metallo-hydrolase [Steroidobacteraceae bacterium]
MWTTCILAMAQAAAAAASSPSAPPVESIAPGVALLRGAMLPERGPDGNTVIFDAPEGLVVVDTGRHAWHSDAILEHSRSRGRPIAAIVNTHWHLDHSSGNGRVKAAHAGIPVYATSAIDGVLSDGGFLARNHESAKAMLDDPKLSATRKEEVRVFLATMAESEVLRPDIVVQSGGERAIAGRSFDLRVTNGAVSEADLWLYDAGTGVAVIGDLVTLPAPFFETACPDRWRESLDAVWAVPFRTAIPGHGEPMDRGEFDAWRGAFNRYVDCVASDSAARQCAATWADGVTQFTGAGEAARKRVLDYAEYYVGMLRENGGKSADCRDQSKL